jgi:CRP/FNR family transcriptional regulator, cyclic AMP receptor protein
MNFADAFGYLGALLVITTYSMRTMVPLRIAGLCSNIAMIAYGFFLPAYPVLILHLILFPLNLWRLREMLDLIREVTAAATGDLSMDWLKPFMDKRTLKAGQILFRRGDVADEMFFVISGRLRLRELGVDILPGNLVGELGMLAPERKRTQTLECVEPTVLQRISYDRMEQLYFQNPQFGVYFLRLTTARLFENNAKLEKELTELRALAAASLPAPAAAAAPT